MSDEAFYTDSEIEDVDGIKQSVSSGYKVGWSEEEYYFFRVSNWQNE